MSEKILIVDDDVDSLKLIGLMLQRHGYEVMAANSGKQGLAKADAEQPSLVILDIMMPDMDGLEVCRRLRANSKTAPIPIIMFTAKTLIDDKVKGFEAGADDYLTKPTHPAELASRVKAILARREAKQAQAPAQPAPRRGTSIGVLGAKGGVGATTVAINLAAAMLQPASGGVIVTDFRLGVGSLGLQLGFGRSQGMARLLVKKPTEIDKALLEGELITHQSGLQALVSSASPKETLLEYDVRTAVAIARTTRAISQTVVHDLGCGLAPTTLKLIPEVDRLVLIVEPNTTALMMGRELIREIEAQNSGGRISVVVVNRSQSSLQTPWHEVENILGREVKGIISAAPELAFQSVEHSTPMILLQPNAIVSGQYTKLAQSMKTRIRSIAG